METLKSFQMPNRTLLTVFPAFFSFLAVFRPKNLVCISFCGYESTFRTSKIPLKSLTLMVSGVFGAKLLHYQRTYGTGSAVRDVDFPALFRENLFSL